MKKKIDARNGLEQYIYSVANTLDEPNLKDKFSNKEKKKVEAAVTAAQQWHASNMEASFEEISAEKKKLEDIFNPIIQKYMQAPQGGMPGQGPTPTPQDDTKIDDID